MFRCDDCSHSFYVPGTNQPLVIEGGCPECGGHARPERDQPSPTNSDGDLRNMVDPSSGNDAGGNPLQEGIFGDTDGGWQNGRVRDESFASVRRGANGLNPCPQCQGDVRFNGQHMQCWDCGSGYEPNADNIRALLQPPPDPDHSHSDLTLPAHWAARGLVPCPDCGGDIDIKRKWDGSEVWQCDGCRREWPDTDEGLRGLFPKGIPCPKCGSDMHFRDAAGLTALHPEGAWECSNQRCWHMMHPGEQVPDTYVDPDTGHSDTTLPEHWGSVYDEFNKSLVPGRSGFDQCPRCHHLIGGNTALLGRDGCPNCGFVINREVPIGSGGIPQEVYPVRHNKPQGMGVAPAPNALMNMIPRQGSHEYVTPMRNHPHASNQTPALPWQFDVEEVAEPGMDNEDAEAKMNGAEKKAFLDTQSLEPTPGDGPSQPNQSSGSDGGSGGGGGIMGLLQRAVPSLMGQAVGGGAGAAGAGGAAGLAEGAVGGLAEAAPLLALASDKPGGGTPGEFPTDTYDPEHVDPKEHNDGDNTHFQNDVSVNDIGGPNGATEPTPGLEALQMLLPLVVHYAESPNESALDHPLLAPLHQLLSDEGHLNGPDDPQAVIEIIQHAKGKGHDDSTGLPKADDAEDTDQSDDGKDHDDYARTKEAAGPDYTHGVDFEHHSPEERALNLMRGEGREAVQACPGCGRTVQFMMGGCPNCAYEAPAGAAGRVAASHQGPHSPEQIAAVQQLLISEGRTDEVPNVPLQPWEYADELAQIANSPDMPPQEDASQPQPVQEEAPPEDTMPMPGMSAPPPGQFGTATSHVYAHDHANHGIQGAPAADQLGQEDISQEQDSSGQWQTDDGQPLIVGEQYELHTPGVDIPDIVRVKAVRPEAVALEFTGAYELGFSKNITRQEFDEMGYTLTHVRGDEPEAQSSQDANSAPDAAVYQDFSGPGSGAGDLSTPHQVMTSWKVTAGDGYESDWGGPGERYRDQPGEKPIYVEAPFRNAFTGQNDTYRGPVMKIIPTTSKRGEELHSLVINPMTTLNVRPGEYNVVGTDDLNNTPEVGPDQPEHFAGARQAFMPGAPGGTQPGGQCQQCGGPLQPNGACAGCERSNIAPGAPGVVPAPAGVQNPNGGPPAQAMSPGGSNPSRPPISRPPGTYASVPSRDPETGQLLDAEAQTLIARLLANAANDEAGEGADGADVHRTAGAHFSPNEQRELIEEDGTARNADKLDLTNTHYETRRQTTADDFMWGL